MTHASRAAYSEGAVLSAVTVVAVQVHAGEVDSEIPMTWMPIVSLIQSLVVPA